MVTLTDYRKALCERNECEFESAEWKMAQEKLNQIIEEGLAEGNYQIAREVQDGIIDLMECDLALDDERIANLIELLENNGFSEFVEEVKEYYFED